MDRLPHQRPEEVWIGRIPWGLRIGDGPFTVGQIALLDGHGDFAIADSLLSHRHLRYASGLLHLILLGSSLALLGQGAIYAVFLGLQLGLLAAALAGVGIARYYVLITWATVVALWNYLRRGVPATWAPQREGLA